MRATASPKSAHPGLWETYGYTTLGQLNLARTMSPDYRRQFSYDNLGHLQSTAFVQPGQCYFGYGYGNWCAPATTDSTHGFSYDQVGNRLDHGGSYTTGNRITAFDSCTYGTLADGADSIRTCGGQSTTFSWDADGRLTGYSTNGTSYTFGYDPFGRLVRKSVAGAVSRRFVWEGDNLAAEFDGTGAVLAEYAYYPGGLDNLYAIRVGGVNYYARTDAMGNVRALTNGSGSVSRTYNYDEWGQLYATSQDIQGFNGLDRARFKGALWMGPELDLYFMRNRWYEARTGRFLSEDPIGLEGGINPYTYAGGDPINGTDPTGLDCYVYTWIWRYYVDDGERRLVGEDWGLVRMPDAYCTPGTTGTNVRSPSPRKPSDGGSRRANVCYGSTATGPGHGPGLHESNPLPDRYSRFRAGGCQAMG